MTSAPSPIPQPAESPAPPPALTEAEQAAFLQSIARVRSAATRALQAARATALQRAAAAGATGVEAYAATEAAAQAAVDFITQLHQGLDTVANQALTTGPQPACQAGCAHCCHLRVEATEPEALRIAQHLRTLPAAEQAAATRRLQQHVAASKPSATAIAQTGPWSGHPLPEHAAQLTQATQATHAAGQPCSFLVDSHCSIYSVRPAACRKAHSLSATQCAERTPTIAQNLRWLVDAEAVMAGTALAYRDQALPASAHELNAAVLAALVEGHSAAMLRWYQGDAAALVARNAST